MCFYSPNLTKLLQNLSQRYIIWQLQRNKGLLQKFDYEIKNAWDHLKETKRELKLREKAVLYNYVDTRLENLVNYKI